MQLYTFHLPRFTNEGGDYASALLAWQEQALNRAGGFTQGPPEFGEWLDNSTGKVFRDRVVPYQVATTPDIAQALLVLAFDLFGDQRAIFLAQSGEGQAYQRDDVPSLAQDGAIAPQADHVAWDGKTVALTSIESMGAGVAQRLEKLAQVYTAPAWSLQTALHSLRVLKAQDAGPRAIADAYKRFDTALAAGRAVLGDHTL